MRRLSSSSTLATLKRNKEAAVRLGNAISKGRWDMSSKSSSDLHSALNGASRDPFALVQEELAQVSEQMVQMVDNLNLNLNSVAKVSAFFPFVSPRRNFSASPDPISTTSTRPANSSDPRWFCW